MQNLKKISSRNSLAMACLCIKRDKRKILLPLVSLVVSRNMLLVLISVYAVRTTNCDSMPEDGQRRKTKCNADLIIYGFISHKSKLFSHERSPGCCDDEPLLVSSKAEPFDKFPRFFFLFLWWIAIHSKMVELFHVIVILRCVYVMCRFDQ
jgi:hypothetical protein